MAGPRSWTSGTWTFLSAGLSPDHTMAAFSAPRHPMNKAFVKESDAEEDDDAPSAPSLPAGTKNYMTASGHARMRQEFEQLVKVERPELVKVVAWAAGNGDRSENGDYIYGKKRLREMDRRIRYLTKRLENAVVVDPAAQENAAQVFFGATVTICV